MASQTLKTSTLGVGRGGSGHQRCCNVLVRYLSDSHPIDDDAAVGPTESGKAEDTP